MTAKLPHLTRLLKYRNEHVINRYRKEQQCSKAVANRTFTELLKYFWLAQKKNISQENIFVAIYPEMAHIDAMWHVFLLFTREYQAFCHKYFGEFFHHTPATSHPTIGLKKFKQHFSTFLNYTYDHLGEESVKFWFKDLLSKK
jgi:hypothetical protein